ncbi:hypothetical protein F5878DRAFT_549828 [Lentinula raphanica]|uniref:Uncharacterized protein n=1 Tax=Lentinula raphanica TaxID=153919 RepID=A0AA38U9E2_9AGAR|nr:hypothetical protein F5878DRAFT_549828 [Lentinula raphanica]
MRRCFRSATGQDIINTYQHYTPIDDAIADAFEGGTGPGPSDDTAYTLHFGTNYRQSRWNKAVIDNILQRVPIEMSELHYQICDLDVDIQSAMLWDFIGQAQVSWARFHPRLIGNKAETPAEANTRAQDYNKRRTIDTRLNTWKNQASFPSFHNPNSLLAAPTLNSLERSSLQRTREVLHALGAEGQSSEESGPEDALLVTVPHYRRRIITPMMVDLDQRAKENQSRLLGKKALPRPKHVRVRSEQRSTRTVKKGLPRSLYHRRYLEQLPPALSGQLLIDSKEITGFEQWALAGQPNSDTELDDDI